VEPRAIRRGSAAAAVGAGDDFEQMSVWIFEVQTPAAVVVIDLTTPLLGGVGPVGEIALAAAVKDLVELVLADEEGVVLRGNLAIGGQEVEADANCLFPPPGTVRIGSVPEGSESRRRIAPRPDGRERTRWYG
jgi:hypothetical protein